MSFLREYWAFLSRHWRWWLVSLVLVLLAAAILWLARVGGPSSFQYTTY